MPHGRLLPTSEPHRRPDLGNKAVPGSLCRSRSPDLAVPVLADGFGRIGSATKVLALRKKCTRKLGMGEERFGRNGRRGNDLGNELSAFGHIDLSGLCLPDPSSRGLVKFADGDRLHVTHCVTTFDTKQGSRRHTFATNHLRDGVDIRTVQSWLGHRDIQSTMVYLKRVRSKDAAQRVNSGELAELVA